MKKIVYTLVAVFIIIVLGILCMFDKKQDNLKKVKVAEVAHSIFYAPQYVAKQLGYFEDEGLKVISS